MTKQDQIKLENALYPLIKKIIKENKTLLLKEDEGDVEKGEKSKGGTSSKRRAIIIKWLKNDAVNDAAIMRQLWDPSPEDEDAKRSYFYKCRDGVTNDMGSPYRFSEDEINKLFKIKSHSTVSN